jgi:hypothetical protein
VGIAHADTTVTIVATDPQGATVSLDRNQSFYLRIAYTTDAPVEIWARPYLRGNEVPATTNASVLHSGSGDALGWFEFIEPGEVDEIRIKVSEPFEPHGSEIARYPVHITGTDQPAAERTRAAWVERLIREEADMQKQEMAHPPAGDGLFTFMITLAIPLLLLGGFAAPAWAWWRWRGGWRGGWRIAAAIPGALMALVACVSSSIRRAIRPHTTCGHSRCWRMERSASAALPCCCSRGVSCAWQAEPWNASRPRCS